MRPVEDSYCSTSGKKTGGAGGACLRWGCGSANGLRLAMGRRLFYTSGTTGAAKGVPLSHANLVFQIDSLLGADLVSEDDQRPLATAATPRLPLRHGDAHAAGGRSAHRLAPIPYGSAARSRPERRRSYPHRRRPAALRCAVFRDRRERRFGRASRCCRSSGTASNSSPGCVA